MYFICLLHTMAYLLNFLTQQRGDLALLPSVHEDSFLLPILKLDAYLYFVQLCGLGHVISQGVPNEHCEVLHR